MALVHVMLMRKVVKGEVLLYNHRWPMRLDSYFCEPVANDNAWGIWMMYCEMLGAFIGFREEKD